MATRSDITDAEVLGKAATLYLYRDEAYYPYSGIVADFRYKQTTTDYSSYSVTLVPHLWLLGLSHQSRIFQRMTVPAIVRQVLDAAGLADYYRVDLQATYPEREYLVQYKESDLEFVCRILEESGIWFFFKEQSVLADEIEGVGTESVVITDKPDLFVQINGESTISYRPPTGFPPGIDGEDKEYCDALALENRMTSRNVFVKNYNYRTPEVNVSAQNDVLGGSVGTHYEYGGAFGSADAAQKAARVVAGSIAAGAIVAQGTGICRGFRAGMRFVLAEHVRAQCNDTFLITSIIHGGGHKSISTGGAKLTYSNTFSLLPAARIALFAPQRRHVRAPLPGVITAQVEANGSEYASLDEQGRYKVRLPFDISGANNSESSKYVRLAQPYSGAGYGLHFPSHEGAEMVLACIDGNPDRPLGLGMVPNANTASPVGSANKVLNVIRTAGSNEIVLDDTTDKQKIRITTAALNALCFDDEHRLLYLQSTDGNKLLIDDENSTTTLTANEHALTLSYGDSDGIVISTSSGHVIKLDDSGTALTIQTSGGHAIQMDDAAKTITLADGQGKNTVTLKGTEGLVLDSQGKITITAVQDVLIKGANVALQSTSGKIDVKATQDLVLSGLNVQAKATVGCKLKGVNMELAADMAMKVKGGVQAEFSSSGMTTVSGQGMCTVKGAMVMIN
jgi:type VI secretion system secreted protein VgrG